MDTFNKKYIYRCVLYGGYEHKKFKFKKKQVIKIKIVTLINMPFIFKKIIFAISLHEKYYSHRTLWWNRKCSKNLLFITSFH